MSQIEPPAQPCTDCARGTTPTVADLRPATFAGASLGFLVALAVGPGMYFLWRAAFPGVGHPYAELHERAELAVILLPLLSLVLVTFYGVVLWLASRRAKPTAIARFVLAGMLTYALWLLPLILFAGRTCPFPPPPDILVRMKPLVEAMHRYCSDHDGTPPSSLEFLVPRYLPAIPETGDAHRVQLQIRGRDSDVPAHTPWILMIPRNFDYTSVLIYSPDGNYDGFYWEHGPYLRGDWAGFGT